MAADGTARRGRPLRILMTADTLGGTWTHALGLARALHADGHRVTLATMGRLPDRAQRRDAAAIAGLDLHASAFRLVWMDDPWDDVAAAADWLGGLAERLRPDVVHLNDLGHGHLAWRAPVLTVVHSCVLSWWRAVHGVAAPGRWARYATHVRRSLAAADYVAAPTQAMLDQARRLYGPLRAAGVIANASDAPPPPCARREPLVLCAGRLWDEAKNVAALAAVAPRLAWPVLLAGASEPPHAARPQPPLRNVTRLGQLDGAALRRWLVRAPIYALPARYEPFGLSVLEAAQAGCALVLGDIPSLRENWDGAALFVAPDDLDALAATLERLIADEALRSRLGAAAAARAAQSRFAPRTMAAAYLEAYADLLAARRRQAGRPERTGS